MKVTHMIRSGYRIGILIAGMTLPLLKSAVCLADGGRNPQDRALFHQTWQQCRQSSGIPEGQKPNVEQRQGFEDCMKKTFPNFGQRHHRPNQDSSEGAQGGSL